MSGSNLLPEFDTNANAAKIKTDGVNFRFKQYENQNSIAFKKI